MSDPTQEENQVEDFRMSPEHYVQEFKKLLEDFTGEIPTELVDSTTPPKDGRGYKVRKGWFFQVGGYLSLCLDDGYIEDPELIEDIGKFSKFIGDDSFKKRWTTESDIDVADELLRRAIAEVKKSNQ